MTDLAQPPTGSSAGDARFCTGCGDASCAGCRRPLDPPRFCRACGLRLTVAVTPAGYRARCRHHGPVRDP